MFERIFKLKLKGAAFTSETILPLFANPKDRISVVYGKNGTGKSTISKAVLKSSGVSVPELTTAQLLDDQEKAIVFSPNSDSRRIYVFNENYVQSNIRLKEDGLDTIVMFGQQVDLETKIGEAQTRYDVAEAARQKAEGEYTPYTDSSSITSPQYYIRKMNLALSGDEKWSGRVRIIDSSRRRNASVNDSTYLSIIEKKPELPLDKLQTEYTKKIEQLRQAEAGTGKILTSVRVDYTVPFDEEQVAHLLAERIERPELSDRESYLLSLLEQGNGAWLAQMNAVFLDDNLEICPFCLQPVDAAYRTGLSESIRKVLSQIVEEHKIALQRLIVEQVSIDFHPFELLASTVLDDCKKIQQQLNDEITRVNAMIQEKIDKPYSPIVLDKTSISQKLKELNGALFVLEQLRKEHNKPYEDAVTLRKELLILNDQIAYYEILELYNSFIAQNAKSAEARKKLDDLTRLSEDRRIELDALIDQKKNIGIALEIINTSLRYVFFSTNRLEVHSEDGCYKLYSNGYPVKPSDISVGERNVLALCYFFTEVLRQQDESQAYYEECFLVIDDPVSSFDRDSRIGILSFLKLKLNSVICANCNSKVILLTHDLQTAFDIERICSEIQVNASRIHGNGIGTYKLLELCQQSLVDFRFKKRNEYTEMLTKVYSFGCSATIEDEISIGNVMRRVLESFSTFIYKKGYAEISCDETILNGLPDQSYINYFRCLMYRLVLNGESHMEERSRGGSDTDFCEMLTLSEKQRTARDIVVFIYLLNPSHVIAHLSNEPTAEAVIDSWCEEIKRLNL